MFSCNLCPTSKCVWYHCILYIYIYIYLKYMQCNLKDKISIGVGGCFLIDVMLVVGVCVMKT